MKNLRRFASQSSGKYFFIAVSFVFFVENSPSLSANALTDALDGIKNTLENKDTGLAATNRRTHEQQSNSYLELLFTDLTFMSVIVRDYAAELESAKTKLDDQMEKLKADFNSVQNDKTKSASEKYPVVLDFAEKAWKLRRDSSRISQLRLTTTATAKRLLEIYSTPCKADRLQLMKDSLDASRYLQRRSVSINDFRDQVQSMYQDLSGLNTLNAAANQSLNDLQKYANRPPDQQRFYFAVSYSSSGNGGSATFTDGKNYTGMLSTVAAAAYTTSTSITAAAAAGTAAATTAAAAGTATAMMAVAAVCGIAAVAVVAFVAVKLLVDGISASNDAKDQLKLVQGINDVMSAAVPSAAESAKVIDDACEKMSAAPNDLVKSNMVELSKLANSNSDLSADLLYDQPYWSALEQLRKNIDRPQAAQIKSALAEVLQHSKDDLGHRGFWARRTAAQVSTGMFNDGVNQNPLIQLERQNERRALRVMVENYLPDADSKKAPLLGALTAIPVGATR